MLSPTAQLALIGALSTGGSAVMGFSSAWLVGRQRRADRREDWKRQDEVAEKADETARILKTTAETINTVHKLVNSEKTEALRRELEETETSLTFLLEIARLNKADGQDPLLPTTADAIAKKKGRVEELRGILRGRDEQAALIAKQTDVMAAREKRLATE